ncbi:MAG: TIGR01212 family radical SAM protein [Elusimicrobiota bacterium]|jgi:radical SAM protein (TIGR01212 family)|nr:TIGR01212 family radical SAM protein [Elusimicrobiota bacterium]
MIYNNRKYSEYLKEKYGERVHKISLNAGFSCPNKNACIYCNNASFNYLKNSEPFTNIDIETQIVNGIKFIKKRFKANKFILYFQTNTNTNASIDVLKNKFDIIYKFPDVIGLNISTRPDCVDDEILDLICEYTKKYEVWLEYGLQSIHNKTLKLINRGHSFEDFEKAVINTRDIGKNIKICVHLIIGLPNETEKDIMQSIDMMNHLKIDGIKLHPMHIVKNTVLADIYKIKNFEFNFFDINDYIKILVKILDKLDKKIIIHGFSGYCPKNILIEPKWLSNRDTVILELKKY